MTNLYLSGLMIGFIMAIPVGPVGLLVIRRALTSGISYGLIAGIGSTAADTLFAAIAIIGIGPVIESVQEYRNYLQLVGGSVVLAFGIYTFLQRSIKSPGEVDERYISGFATCFFLTISNPLLILGFIATFTGFKVIEQITSLMDQNILIFGVFTGSALWFLTLSITSGLFRNAIKTGHLEWINRITGLLLFLFGLYIILSFFYPETLPFEPDTIHMPDGLTSALSGDGT